MEQREICAESRTGRASRVKKPSTWLAYLYILLCLSKFTKECSKMLFWKNCITPPLLNPREQSGLSHLPCDPGGTDLLLLYLIYDCSFPEASLYVDMPITVSIRLA